MAVNLADKRRATKLPFDNVPIVSDYCPPRDVHFGEAASLGHSLQGHLVRQTGSEASIDAPLPSFNGSIPFPCSALLAVGIICLGNPAGVHANCPEILLTRRKHLSPTSHKPLPTRGASFGLCLWLVSWPPVLLCTGHRTEPSRKRRQHLMVAGCCININRCPSTIYALITTVRDPSFHRSRLSLRSGRQHILAMKLFATFHHPSEYILNTSI